MSSEMTGQTPCLTSRWDQPAHPKSADTVIQNTVENAAHSISLSEVVGSAGSSQPLQAGAELLTSEIEKPVSRGGVEMAAAMAAKINAMLMAKGKLLTPQPLLPKTSPSVQVPIHTEATLVTEVDINDVPLNCRNLLTKGKTQEEIRQFSGAAISTKGHYMSEVEKGEGQRPLYLHVQGKTQEQVNKAVMRIKEIISEDVMRASAASGGQQLPVIPPITLYPQPPRPAIPAPVPRMPITNSVSGQGHRPAAPHSGNFVHTKIFVGLDHALPSFNVNEKVEGPGGSYLNHIQTETGARVFLRGKGSGYIEQASKRESFEPLYVYISHPNQAGLDTAKKLTESLLKTVTDAYARTVSTYTPTSSNQPYAAHGFPPNSNYSSQASWYSYPANGYAGGYSAYPGAGGYWSNANGPPSHSNISTNPPSSQAMVQYPVCPRNPHPYLNQDPGSSETVEPEARLSIHPEPGSPKRLQEEAEKEQPTASLPDSPPHDESTCLASSVADDNAEERVLMPPPPPPLVTPAAITRKRPRDTVTEDEVSLPSSTAPMAVTGCQAEVCKKQSKLDEDASGLVPYGGDSSDEEEETTHSSKTDNS
ncbi:KH homology domain-containing protein 4-like isoform X2 [Thalassophryne amazonica]|uniref:KH homology domain-containing protein 4-like isoform X2 n=1 Tax=Thalassophryne amazonica TaxID=390379 RepID=UPI00147224B7|nr:KH homology domain-containing protein 4-like isoform X2 [Thalassophryne amazonica]